MVERKLYDWCFACGKENPIGLHLKFKKNDEELVTEFVPQKEHQSYDGRMHGGLISTLLDEAMGQFLYMHTGKPAYTAKLEVRFKQPVLIGEKITVRTKVIKQKGRLVEMSAEMTKAEGMIVATAEAKLMYEGA
ncbi:MAG TPA: hotdog fold thioesterase [Candidatus Avacidaminococcus intestinavium]|uniref:Acyl-coenzyme A thioesterase THEM4 n=1 Tax=Candidatus Avacidaminococcus intestinavium TaxID=2840684 RepID=A0A9D1MQL4_9FIRM|nr:hotdog fold thioesterase [Candidatus Avacidaminococcus intestinavium]